MGPLVRVLPGVHSDRPNDFSSLAKQKELYFTFLTLAHALRAKLAHTYPARAFGVRSRSYKLRCATEQVAGRHPKLSGAAPGFQAKFSIHEQNTNVKENRIWKIVFASNLDVQTQARAPIRLRSGQALRSTRIAEARIEPRT